MSTKRFALVSGFVDQEEMLIPSLTVRETLLFSANLRLPESVTRAERHVIVDKTLEELGINHIAHSRIGGNGVRGISGGEKRRVSIGIELVTSPSILLLDEPTSGLDSYNAHILVQVRLFFLIQFSDISEFGA
jgi:ABC-type multidrug transport system ATPase subunit